MNYKKLDVPLFPATIVLIVGSDNKAICKKFPALATYLPSSKELFGFSAWSYLDSKHKGKSLAINAFYLILNDDSLFDITPGVVAHEANHIKDFILEYVGETSNPPETSSYLIQWIVDETTKFLENVRKKKTSNRVSRKRKSS